jgi:7-cyano-7-deazaguanine synthase
MANLGTKAGVEGERFTVHAPLLQLSKADIVREARGWARPALSWSCYDPTPELEHCGLCDACRLRSKGL